jgi:branched-chain amino acid transport system substrate-binding protein
MSNYAMVFIRNIAKCFYSVLLTWIILPLIGVIVAGAITGRIVDRFIRPDSYKVYLVGKDDHDFFPKMWDEFKGNGNLKIDSIPISTVQRDDRGEKGTAKRISANLTKKHDTLMVVGHINSTTTHAALPNYLQKVDPPIPVILTTETNPNLLPPKVSEITYYPVFRLSPTDEKQATAAADLVVSKEKANAIWVVEDTSNPVYSRYLAEEFIKRAHQLKSGRVLLWSTNKEIPLAATVKELKIDWIFFAGNCSNALILIRQIKTMWAGKPAMPHILLSEGCADPLLEQGGDEVENVYIMSLLSIEQYEQYQSKGSGTFWGKSAHEILKQVIEKANDNFALLGRRHGGLGYWIRWILGIHSACDARMVLGASMEWAASGEFRFTLPGVGEVHFKHEDGTIAESQFKVWQVQGKKFVDVSLSS